MTTPNERAPPLGYHMRGDPWRQERFAGRTAHTMQSARAGKAREK